MNIYMMMIFFMMMNLIVYSTNSKHWISLWMTADLLVFLSLVLLMKLSNNIELNIKLMLINLITSMLLLSMIMNLNNYLLTMLNKFLIVMILWMKNSFFPFTLWMLFACKMNSWLMFFMLMMMTKIPYCIMLMFLLNMYILKLMMLIILLPLMNFNLTNLKMIFLILSTNNMLWIVLTMNMNSVYWFINLMIYFLFNLFVFMFLNKNKINYINQTMVIPNNKKIMFLMLMFNLMNLPPMTMFLLKWILIKVVFMNKLMVMLFMINNIFSFALYMKMFINYLNLNNSQMKWIKNSNLNIMNFLLCSLLVLFILLMI